jgi:hypothetical protein
MIVTGASSRPEVHGFLATEAARMKMIQTTIEVDDERRATIQLPADVTPGSHQAVVVIEDRDPAAPRPQPTMVDFPRHDVQVNLPEDFTFRREQIYDDSGRGA